MRQPLRAIVSVMLLVAVGAPGGGLGMTEAAPGPTIQGDARTIAELTETYRKFAEARTWRSRMQIPGSPPATYTVAYVAPDRFHMVIGAGGTTVSEYFLIAGEAWAKAPTGCAKLPTRIALPNPKEGIQQADDAVIQAVRAGTESVEGTPTQTYNLVITTRGTMIRQKLFVATATGLPRRVEVSVPQGTMTIDYFDYNAPIAINNPPC